MKFRMKVTNGPNNEWWEEYDKDTTNAQQKAKEIVAFFNSTLLPDEKARRLLAVEVLSANSCRNHEWQKQNLVASVDNRGVYDIMRCVRCGVTGKRRGFDDDVMIDRKYRAKVYRRCDTSQAHLEKLEQRRLDKGAD